MSEILSLERWNSLIQQFNDYVESIDEECNPPEPLELVEAPHIWTRQDVTEFQDRLREICDCNNQLLTFQELPKLWQERIIQDIEFALSIGACKQGDTDEQVIELGTFGPCVSKQCGNEAPTRECGGSGQSMPVDLTQFLAANQQEPVADENVLRTWRITEQRTSGPVCAPYSPAGSAITEHNIFTGIIKCDGTLEPPDPIGESPGPQDITNWYVGEFLVQCFPDCDDACNTTYNEFKTCAFQQQPRTLKLYIKCNDCQTCEELGYDEHNANPGGGGEIG